MSAARKELALTKTELVQWQLYALIIGLVAFIAGLTAGFLVTKTKHTREVRRHTRSG